MGYYMIYSATGLFSTVSTQKCDYINNHTWNCLFFNFLTESFYIWSFTNMIVELAFCSYTSVFALPNKWIYLHPSILPSPRRQQYVNSYFGGNWVVTFWLPSGEWWDINSESQSCWTASMESWELGFREIQIEYRLYCPFPLGFFSSNNRSAYFKARD